MKIIWTYQLVLFNFKLMHLAICPGKSKTQDEMTLSRIYPNDCLVIQQVWRKRRVKSARWPTWEMAGFSRKLSQNFAYRQNFGSTSSPEGTKCDKWFSKPQNLLYHSLIVNQSYIYIITLLILVTKHVVLVTPNSAYHTNAGRNVCEIRALLIKGLMWCYGSHDHKSGHKHNYTCRQRGKWHNTYIKVVYYITFSLIGINPKTKPTTTYNQMSRYHAYLCFFVTDFFYAGCVHRLVCFSCCLFSRGRSRINIRIITSSCSCCEISTIIAHTYTQTDGQSSTLCISSFFQVHTKQDTENVHHSLILHMTTYKYSLVSYLVHNELLKFTEVGEL